MSDFLINGMIISDMKWAKPVINADGTAGVIIGHTDNTETTHPFPDSTSAQIAYNGIVAVRGAQNVSKPVISSLSPSAMAKGSLPLTLSVSGSNFDSTAVITLVAYNAASVALTTTFNNASSLSATVPGAVTAGVWNVVYTDTNGNTFVVENGLVIT